MQRTFVFISSFLLCLIVSTTIAQKKKQIIVPPDSTNLLNGFTVHIDAASLVTSSLMSNSTYSTEGGIQMDLRHRIFPTFEIGIAGANKLTTDKTGYKTNGLFERIGVDFNLQKKKKDTKPTNNLFLAGVRIGMSNFNYNITNLKVTDDYWGGTELINYLNQPATKIWYEIVVGVQVEVFRNFYMGWTVRNKNLFSKDVPGGIAPWYIPGFGTNNGTNWGFNYTIGYHFLSKKKVLKNNKVFLNQNNNQKNK